MMIVLTDTWERDLYDSILIETKESVLKRIQMDRNFTLHDLEQMIRVWEDLASTACQDGWCRGLTCRTGSADPQVGRPCRP